MTSFIISMIVFSIILIGISLNARRRYYLDQSIYQFRQSKHELLMYINENAATLDRHEFLEARKLLSMFDHTITNFSKHNQMFWSITKFVIINTIKTNQTLGKAPGKHLEEYSKGYAVGIRKSLEAIPFLKTRMIIIAVTTVFKILVALGVKKLNSWIARLDSFRIAEDNLDEHCLA